MIHLNGNLSSSLQKKLKVMYTKNAAELAYFPMYKLTIVVNNTHSQNIPAIANNIEQSISIFFTYSM